MKTWQDLGFQREVTGDGSLSLKGLTESSEAMHHSGGALSETLLIYGKPLQELFESLERPRVFSLGLGLGYVEMVVAALSVKTQKDFEMVTMESEQGLRDVVQNFVQSGEVISQVTEDLSFVFSQIAEALQLAPEIVRQCLQRALSENRWQILGAMGPGALPPGQFHGLMYDAFSSKTSPSLWSEEFLSQLLVECAAPDSLLSTYACTGNLKRSLKNQGFQVILREGFQGKRSATLGRRGCFIVPPDPGTCSHIQ